MLRAMFVVWAIAVAALSVISYPGSEDLLMAVKFTSSGFVVHGVAYFVGMWLCFLAFEKKNISFVVWAGLLIFLFGVVLEVVQFYLPCRTFNVYDVVANACGVLLFGVWMLFISHRPTPVRSSGPTGHAQTDTDFCPADPAGQK